MMDEATLLSALRGVLPLATLPVGAWLALWAAAREGVGPGPKLSQAPRELVAALLIAHFMALFFAPGWTLLASLILAWALIGLAWIDWRRMLLPDFLTLPLILVGLCLAWARLGAAPVDQLIGAAAGFLIVAGLALAYRRWRGFEGLGLGDAKLLAAGGAWLGWQGLASMTLLGAIGALAFLAGERALGRKRAAQEAIPFGPFLALGFWIVWLFGSIRPFS